MQSVMPLGKGLIDQLKKDMKQALQDYHCPDTENSPLAYLRLFLDLQRLEGKSTDEATIMLLDKALDKLNAKTENLDRKLKLDDYTLLIRRFVKGEKAKEGDKVNVIYSSFNLSEPYFFKRQTQALARLTKIVYEMEIEARRIHQENQRQRLGTPAPQKLIGAEGSLADLRALLLNPQAPWLVVLKGSGGIGKTTLADTLVRRMIPEDAWDDIAWVTAKQVKLTAGGGLKRIGQPAITVEALVESLFEQLLPHAKLASFADPMALMQLETRLKENPCLIVIDNLETFPDSETLLPLLQRLANPSKFILTTREKILDTEGEIAYFQVPPLSEDESLSLIHQLAKDSYLAHVTATPEADLRAIYATVGGIPLALKLVIGQLSEIPLPDILEAFKQSAGEPIENLYDFIYEQAWARQNELSRSVLLAMLLLNERGGSIDILEHITQMPRGDVYTSLNKLTTFSLVESRGSTSNERFYSMHNLTRTFVTSTLLPKSSLPSNPSNDSAKFNDYTYRATEYVLRMVQYAGPILTVEEREQVLHTLQYAFQADRAWQVTRALLLATAPKMELAGFHTEWVPYLEQGVLRSRIHEETQTEAYLQLHLGLLYQVLGNYEGAQKALTVSGAHFGALGDPVQQATAITRKANVARLQRRNAEARSLVGQALTLFAQDDPHRQFSYFVLGTLALNDNDPAQAADWFKQSLTLCEQLNDKRLIAQRWGNVGLALYLQRQFEAAQDCYQRSITLFIEAQDDVQRAVMQMNLGNLYLVSTQPDKALELYTLAEPPLNRAHDSLHLAMIDLNRGIAKRQLHEWQQAEQLLQKSIVGWEKLGDIVMLGKTLYQLGLLYYDQKAMVKAQTIFQGALKRLDEIQPDPARDALYKKITSRLQGMDTEPSSAA